MLAVVALVVLAGAVVVARVIERGRPDAPLRDGYPVPRQLDRHDFERPDAPWLVVLFSSATCTGCAPMWLKVAALASDDVAVMDVEYGARRDLHERYGVEGVPMVVLAGSDGVVHGAWVGAVSATELWDAVAAAREPGTSSNPGFGRLV